MMIRGREQVFVPSPSAPLSYPSRIEAVLHTKLILALSMRKRPSFLTLRQGFVGSGVEEVAAAKADSRYSVMT